MVAGHFFVSQWAVAAEGWSTGGPTVATAHTAAHAVPHPADRRACVAMGAVHSLSPRSES